MTSQKKHKFVGDVVMPRRNHGHLQIQPNVELLSWTTNNKDDDTTANCFLVNLGFMIVSVES